MAQPIDITQTPEYLELLQVSEEMEADFKKMLSEKDVEFAAKIAERDAVLSAKEKQSQARIAQLEADIAGRDKELESYVEELEGAHQAALTAKDRDVAELKRVLAEAEDKLRLATAAAVVGQICTSCPFLCCFCLFIQCLRM
jgi:predicted  nucleic acid-binding Zn-ribbon protein